MTTMLFGVLTSLSEKINPTLDGVELRLDLFEEVDFLAVEQFIQHFDRLVLLTWHNASSSIQKKLFGLRPNFVDIGWNKELEELYPEVKTIASYHNYEETPDDLEAIWEKMPPCNVIKIATFANSSLDALRLLLFVKEKKALGFNVIGIAMGPLGQITRILAPKIGNFINYIPLGKATAPGQLSELPKVDASTEIYALIGYPLIHVLSHVAHQAVFNNWGMKAIYLKIPLKQEEVESFFPLAKALDIRGISVTTPLKETVIPYLDHIEEEAISMGAVNTITLRNGDYHGSNTDGKGALNAIEAHMAVAGKQVVLIGAGGAAKAIGYEAKKRGANLVILNRTSEKALQLAKELGGLGGGLDELPVEYDILINCTPHYSPIDTVLPNALVMDIKAFPQSTSLLAQANHQIEGVEMFIHQAILQEETWLQKSDPIIIRKATEPLTKHQERLR